MNANYSEAIEQQLALVREYSQINKGGFEGQAVRALNWSEPFYVSGDIGRFIEKAGDCLPSGTVHRSLLPVPRAFLLLDRPLLVAVDSGVGDHLVSLEIGALSWAVGSFTSPNPGYGVPEDEQDGIAITVFLRGPSSRKLGVGYQTTWRWGIEVDDTSPHVIDGSLPLNQSDDTLLSKCRRFTLAFLLFVQQRILVAPSHQAERAARKRLERSGFENAPAVRVVQLRRKEALGGVRQAGEADTRDWAFQWVVRGHWRQQFYPSKGINQPIWITPYVKGPEDKPLKPPRATVFAVVR